MELTVEDLARALQCSTSKLLRLTRAGQLPHLRIGRLIRYDLAAVKAALAVPVRRESVSAAARPVGRGPVPAARIDEWRAQIRAANKRRRAEVS